MKKHKVLIFIVAYNAEKHIEKVLNRIPLQLFKQYNYEILIIDDSSGDKTFELGKKYKLKHQNINLKVLRNPVNQGYGGNQKLGYQYAIQNHFDIVVLLHGDGQYAPELLLDMIKPIALKKADAVFGSRMMRLTNALKGKMPLYKLVGNRILSGLQNQILGSNLSEFHSGYRAYSIKVLSQIPFQRNSNDFDFDTQIIIQFLLASKNIVEIPIPTYYGDEICHVDGIKYGINVIKSSVLSRLHQISILYQREFDIQRSSDYSLKIHYPSSHSLAIEAVKEKSKVMDIGCNRGYLASYLISKKCLVDGIDNIKTEEIKYIHQYWQRNLENSSRLPLLDKYDFILLLDVIEHLANPEIFLDQVRIKAKSSRPTLIITTGNIGFFVLRIQLLFGNFNYGKQGILDLTHKRLFTFYSLKKLCLSCGYKINTVRGIPAPFQKAIGDNKLSRTLQRLNEWLITINKDLFSYQIYMETEITPVVSQLLSLTIKGSQVK